MYQEISQLLMYGDLDEDSILYQMGEIFGKYETGEYNKTGLVRDINVQVKRILKVATDYGFDDNLWHNYLTFFLMMSENPFSMTCEKVGASREASMHWYRMISAFSRNCLTMISGQSRRISASAASVRFPIIRQSTRRISCTTRT